jgi:hypothetical protein
LIYLDGEEINWIHRRCTESPLGPGVLILQFDSIAGVASMSSVTGSPGTSTSGLVPFRVKRRWIVTLGVIYVVAGIVPFASSISPTLAGSCSGEIDAVMARVQAALEARAGSGPGAQEHAVVGGRHIQPTPGSIAAAEEKLGAIEPKTVELVIQAMERARDADRAGDNVACGEALAEIRRAIAP